MANYDDDYDDTFENGVMRDGARHRVPMHMRDSQAPMITDGTGDPLGLASTRLAHPHRRQRTRCSAPRQSAQTDRRSPRRVSGSPDQRVEGQPIYGSRGRR